MTLMTRNFKLHQLGHILVQALSMAASANCQLPESFLALAGAEGIKRSAVLAYVSLQKGPIVGWLARTVPWFRDRLIYDRRFLFKVGAEIAIDSGCATAAEFNKRGAKFWDEFEFYLSDLLVGLVMDVALVGLMAPVAVLGKSRPVAKGGAPSHSPSPSHLSIIIIRSCYHIPRVCAVSSIKRHMQHCNHVSYLMLVHSVWKSLGMVAMCNVEMLRAFSLSAAFQRLCDKAPAAFFEANIPGVRTYGLPARFGCLGVKFLEYSLGGIVCGLVGQGLANAAMHARRARNPDAVYTVDIPPLLPTALVWGLFMGVSSNIRYQTVFGLERLVDLTIAKRVPEVRCFFCIGCTLARCTCQACQCGTALTA